MAVEVDCVFCEIIETHIAEDFRQHGELTVSFVPLNPVTPGHRLFVPIIHHTNAGAGAPYAASAFFSAANWAAKKDMPFNLITSGGKEATQTIFHTHLHYVPRHENDGLMLPWTEHYCL